MPEQELAPRARTHESCPAPEMSSQQQVRWPGYVAADSCAGSPTFVLEQVTSHHCAMPSDVVGRDPQPQSTLEQHQFRPPTT